MPKKSPQKRDGVYERKDRKGFWISWTDAQGRRRHRKTDAQNIIETYMKCPVCKTEELDFSPLENNLTSRHCDKCGGNWIPSFEYWKWREQHKGNLPESLVGQTIPPNPVTGPLIAKLCPECNMVLIKFRVGHGANFSLDQCGNCGGVWFDEDEWEALKARNLHEDVYLIFTAPWQDQVRSHESRRAQEAFYRSKFGDEGFNEIQRVKAWIDGHPLKKEILAYLMSG